ncbi:zf-HC2 domain-containing protein [Angustibacter peucedani]
MTGPTTGDGTGAVPHDEFELAAGAYVLGALSPSERAAFARHLPTCPACQGAVEDLAGLPGLLSRVRLEDVERLADAEGPATADVPPLPPELLTGLLREVRRRRQRRLAAFTAVAAAAAAVLVVAGIAIGRPATPPAGQAMTSISPEAVTATVALEPVGWGTRLDLVCQYEDPSRGAVPYSLVVVARDGRTEQVGSWTAKPGETARMEGATSWTSDDIAAVEVRASSGLAVLRLDRSRPGATGSATSYP